MNLLTALEKHIPSARLLLEGTGPLGVQEISFDPEEADLVCALGLSASLYEQAREWLDEDPKRRLVFVEDRPEALAQLLEEGDSILLLNDLRVKIYFLETHLQLAQVAKQIAWSGVFLKIKILDAGRTFPHLREEIGKIHLAADLLLSDAADWGCTAFRNAKKNLAAPFYSVHSLQGRFANIPALIIGAGPSLEKNGHLLKEWKNKALLFAGGNALTRIDVAPHFAACIDKEEEIQIPFPDVPFCFQARMRPDTLSHSKGKRFLAPDGHFSFLNWLASENERFDGGWTVGNFMAALAVLWGCNPIIFVGMDYCYSGAKKYAHGNEMTQAGLINATDSSGQSVWTQRDWLMSIRWLEELAGRNPDRTFYNATEGGMAFFTPCRLESMHFPQLPEKIDTEVPLLRTSRWDEWKESLQRCQRKLRKIPANLEGEIVYEQLLAPLWPIWRPVFEREIDPNTDPIEKMRLHELLFYRQVVEEHLNVL